MTARQKVYGVKKEFIMSHEDDIKSLRRRMSARKVADVFGGIISVWDIYKMESKKKISKKVRI